MSLEKLDENKPLPVAGRSTIQQGYDQDNLNQAKEKFETKRALHRAIHNGKHVTLDVVKSRLLRGENNEFTVSIVMELAEQLMAYKKTEQRLLDIHRDTASDDPICAPV